MNNLTNLEMIQGNICGFVPWSNGYLCIYLRIIGKITSEEETGTRSFSLQGSNFQTNFQVLLLLLISWIFFSILTVTQITRATENAVTPIALEKALGADMNLLRMRRIVDLDSFVFSSTFGELNSHFKALIIIKVDQNNLPTSLLSSVWLWWAKRALLTQSSWWEILTKEQEKRTRGCYHENG